MSTITTDYNTRVQGNYGVQDAKPLTDAEVKEKILEVQTENLKTIEEGLDQNSAGWGEKVKIKVPADADGKPITNPTAQDWENAARNNSFVEVEDTPAELASRYFGLVLIDVGNAATNSTLNKALLQELRDALGKGISFPTHEPLPRSEIGDIARALQARQQALHDLGNGIGDPKYGAKDTKPRELVEIKVPADAKGNPIKNPSTQDWIDAQKNNRWATVSSNPAELSSDYFGLKIDTQNWRESYKSNKAAFEQASKEGLRKFEAKIQIANGEFSAGGILDIPNSGKIIQEVFEVLGPAYNAELKKAMDLREQMDSLKKKNDALQKLENSISGNNTAGGNSVDFDVPTRRYVYDKDGNKVLDADGKPKTEAITPPPTNEDWARGAEWKSIKELNGGKDINGRDAAKKYFGMTLSHLDGNNSNDHRTNLANNLQKIANERTSVQAEMSKLSGQFDFRMGNAQTNLQNANKIIANLNDMIQSIARSI